MVPLAGLVIALFKRKAAYGGLASRIKSVKLNLMKIYFTKFLVKLWKNTAVHKHYGKSRESNVFTKENPK